MTVSVGSRRAAVLVVDDELDALEMLAFALSDEGFDVLTAESGREAVETMREHPIDVVITDLTMPDMDGIETMSELKRLEPSLEVIVVSGYASIEKATTCMKLGAFDFVPKPYDLRALGELVRDALARRRHGPVHVEPLHAP